MSGFGFLGNYLVRFLQLSLCCRSVLVVVAQYVPFSSDVLWSPWQRVKIFFLICDGLTDNLFFYFFNFFNYLSTIYLIWTILFEYPLKWAIHNNLHQVNRCTRYGWRAILVN